jgi:formamidopyrimidine-DNA glycosylase
MPELPEVEHVRQKLSRWMKGARIVAAHTTDRNVVSVTPKAFAERLRGRTVKEVGRRGKWLRLMLDDGTRIFSHLGMTGWYERDGSDRFERARIEVEKRGKHSVVRYVDPRRWGRIIVTPEDTPSWQKLGPDPLLDGIDAKRLAAKLAKRTRRTIKEVLMDQSVLAGVGNIQAIEALWKAGIDPRSNAAALEAKEIAAIVRGLGWTIKRTLADLAKGENGAENPFKIYGRKGTPCPRCKTLLHRIELGGRTTTFCTGCQKRKRARRPARMNH